MKKWFAANQIWLFMAALIIIIILLELAIFGVFGQMRLWLKVALSLIALVDVIIFSMSINIIFSTTFSVDDEFTNDTYVVSKSPLWVRILAIVFCVLAFAQLILAIIL